LVGVEMAELYCFGCKHLIFNETERMLFGWWECSLLPTKDRLVGEIGGAEHKCWGPNQRCNGKWEYRVKAQDSNTIEEL